MSSITSGPISDKQLKQIYELLTKDRLIEILIEKHKVLRELYDLTYGPYDDPVIQEDLYNRMETAVKL